MIVPKRRMLFLHGMFSNPRIYEREMKVLLDLLKKADWEVTMVESPRVCPDTPPSIMDSILKGFEPHELKEWINSHTHSEDGTKEYVGLTESLDFLQSYLEKESSRFDIIAGHSQGALMTSILAYFMEHNPGDRPFLPADKHCLGILCMNGPGSYETERTLRQHIAIHGPVVSSIPSLHIWGGPTDFTYQGSQAMQKVHHPNGKSMEHEARVMSPRRMLPFVNRLFKSWKHSYQVRISNQTSTAKRKQTPILRSGSRYPRTLGSTHRTSP